MKRFSASWAIRKMQIKTTKKEHIPFTRVVNIKKNDNINVTEMRNNENTCI